MMPTVCKVANAKYEIETFTREVFARYQLPAFIAVGIISEVLNEYKTLENADLNNGYNDIIKTINEQTIEEKKEDVQD